VAAIVVARSVAAGVIDVTQLPHSAYGDNSHADTSAIQSALNTGGTVYLPAAAVCYKVTSALSMTHTDQLLYGDGRTRSTICPSSTTYSTGVIVFTMSGQQPGPQLRDIGIVFVQADTTNRLLLTNISRQ